MSMDRKAFKEGIRDGIPIGLGYLAVSFSLGITAKNAGLNWFQGFLASATTYASAGEYAAFTVIAENAAYIQMALMILIANGRYLLMSCSLSQKFSDNTSFIHRLGIGLFVTDELFGINIARPGEINPSYSYGAVLACIPAWAVGTAIGIVAGEVLPVNVVSALSVALYGMFIAIIVPPAREKKSISILVGICFILSYASGKLPAISKLSGGTRIMILTILIAAVAAIVMPIKDEEEKEANENAA